MKHKLFFYIIILSLLLFSALFLTSCEKADINDLINAKWTSVDSEMEFLTLDAYEGVGSIVYNDQKVEYYIEFYTNDDMFLMMIKPDENPPMGGDISFKVDASGSYVYSEKEKKLILNFSSSDVFGDAFSTITLFATEIDPLKIDPKERYFLSWISEAPYMRFGIRVGDTKGGSGIVQIGDTTHMIFFEWNADQKFSVYLLDENGDKYNTSVMDGSYSGSSVSLVLHLMNDELFGSNYQSITFKPDKDLNWYKKVFSK
ncbi:MAG: hypothetical protein LBF68_00765 [Christensenellaceae bacterium]|jgi:hypothetical protein|nr:hypothetical protein [Christensenellaceae bacterium]